jgi:hypothetical protein
MVARMVRRLVCLVRGNQWRIEEIILRRGRSKSVFGVDPPIHFPR